MRTRTRAWDSGTAAGNHGFYSEILGVPGRCSVPINRFLEVANLLFRGNMGFECVWMCLYPEKNVPLGILGSKTTGGVPPCAAQARLVIIKFGPPLYQAQDIWANTSGRNLSKKSIPPLKKAPRGTMRKWCGLVLSQKKVEDPQVLQLDKSRVHNL